MILAGLFMRIFFFPWIIFILAVIKTIDSVLQKKDDDKRGCVFGHTH